MVTVGMPVGCSLCRGKHFHPQYLSTPPGGTNEDAIYETFNSTLRWAEINLSLVTVVDPCLVVGVAATAVGATTVSHGESGESEGNHDDLFHGILFPVLVLHPLKAGCLAFTIYGHY